MLIESLGFRIYKPTVSYRMQVLQSAMEKVLDGSRNRDNVIYHPQTWINTYEWVHAYDGERRIISCMFPGWESSVGRIWSGGWISLSGHRRSGRCLWVRRGVCWIQRRFGIGLLQQEDY
ncbi:hypothetical protein BJX63DRAFT_411985 [Aspergillus granulosus]|uniref:Uncharacterized protein n=1 Tax=Aspergillus granulosus TaxID=176169 RepID=A0ABR4GWG8_9EURO